MSKRHSWLALAVALALLVGALAPATALASRGGKPLDGTGDPNDPPPMEYGDPEPTGGGAPQQVWTDFNGWKQVLLTSMRIKFGVPVLSTRSASVAESNIRARSKRGSRQ